MIRNSLGIILCLFVTSGLAQYKDAGMWADVSFSTDVSKKLKLSVAPEIRMNENMSHVSRIFSDFGLQAELRKNLSASVTYRLGAANQGNFFESRQRLQWGLAYKNKIDNFSWGVQSRWQLAIADFSGESDADFVTVLRNKLQIKYTGLKKTDVSMAFEIFNNTSNYQNFVMTNWRWTANIERKINKRNAISCGYLIQKSLLDSPQEIDFVVLLSYSCEIKWKKEKKEESPSPEPMD